MRIGLSTEVTDLFKGLVSKAFALPPCQIPGCDKHAISNRFRCETCRRQVCIDHGFLRMPKTIPTEAPIVCVSCVIDENQDLLE